MVEARIENSSWVAAAVRGDHIQRIVEEKIERTESAVGVAVGRVASNSAVFEERIAGKANDAAEKLDN